MRRVLLGVGALLLACSSDARPNPSDPGPGCTVDPLACPAGTTCWPVDLVGRYDCLAAPDAQQAGAPCVIELGTADCAAGLFCHPTEGTNGICSPFCDGQCVCNDFSVNEVKFHYEVRVCAPTAASDAGAG